ncbi:hypothetical protein ACWCXX_39310 [Streptomyces sp. NPDC001732]
MKHRLRAWQMAIAAGMAAAAVLVSQGTAQAATIRCYTNPSYLGHASYDKTSGYLYVDDTAKDGRRVIAEAWRGASFLGWAQDANGSDNGSGSMVYIGTFSSGNIEVNVCTQDGTDSTTRDDCNPTLISLP